MYPFLLLFLPATCTDWPLLVAIGTQQGYYESVERNLGQNSYCLCPPSESIHMGYLVFGNSLVPQALVWVPYWGVVHTYQPCHPAIGSAVLAGRATEAFASM